MKNEKFIIYQMLPRVFGNKKGAAGSGRFGDIDFSVLEGIRKLNVSYIWYTGIIRHAIAGEEGVKGGAGSPYAISDYYDVNPYMASRSAKRMQEFEDLVKRSKEAGMKVLIDFVPNHTSRVYNSATVNFTDENYYPGRTFDGDWSDTAKLNYGSHDTWVKMRDILLFWAGKGIGGFRCDMIELVPVEFWAWCIPQIKKKHKGIIFIGEAYQPENYAAYFDQGGFDYLYDKSGFYDTLRRIVRWEEPASAITREWQRLGDRQPNMLNFLENHDEDRLTSPYFAGNAFRGLAALFVSMFYNTAPFMIYAGQEFGEGPEKTSIFDFVTLPKVAAWIKGLKAGNDTKYLDHEASALYEIYQAFTEIAISESVIRKGQTYDLQYANPYSEHFDPQRQFVFLRKHGKKTFLMAANFTDENVNIKVRIPEHAFEYLGIRSCAEVNAETLVDVHIAPNAGTILRIE